MTTVKYIASRHFTISVSDLRHWRTTQRLTFKFPTISNNKATARTFEVGATLAPLTLSCQMTYSYPHREMCITLLC